MTISTFGERVRARRTALGLTLAELAVKADMHLQAVAKIEAGKRPNPTWETVVALARALGVKTDYFVPEDGDEGHDDSPPEQPARPMGKRK